MGAPPPFSSDDALAVEFKEYAYSVSHDLSAPVRAMVEFSKLLTSEHADALNEEGKEYLGVIIENGKKMQAMMEGLLQYSRLNSMAKPIVPVSVGSIIDDVCVAMEHALRASGAVIERGDLPNVVADYDQLLQVFQILLRNAITYQRAGNRPHIVISAEEKAGDWIFLVVDNGIGIASKYHERIFKLFHRLHTDEEYAGVGIGLTLAQKIIQRHGGAIWCESASGGGTSFYFTVPKGFLYN